MTRPAIDPITLEVARNRFSAIADEMGSVLRRTSLSPNIKERADCSAAVFTVDGEMLAQAEHIPVHLGSMPESVAACLRRFDPIPGSQYAVNDPFPGGTHLNDLTIVAPVFVRNVHVAWVANRAHHADVGGEAPGSMPAHARTVDQEGYVVAPTQAVRAGAWLDDFVGPFVAASRTPWERRGDLDAQLGANAVAARRLAELVEREGRIRFRVVAEALLGYGQRRMEAALAALPDGEYAFDDRMELGERDVEMRVTIRIDAGSLHADFRGTDPQVEANFNAVEAVTRSCLYYAVRVATDPSIPANGGCYRPLSLHAPVGTIVNPTPPAAVAAGNVETSQRTMNNILVGRDHVSPSKRTTPSVPWPHTVWWPPPRSGSRPCIPSNDGIQREPSGATPVAGGARFPRRRCRSARQEARDEWSMSLSDSAAFLVACSSSVRIPSIAMRGVVAKTTPAPSSLVAVGWGDPVPLTPRIGTTG